MDSINLVYASFELLGQSILEPRLCKHVHVLDFKNVRKVFIFYSWIESKRSTNIVCSPICHIDMLNK
jgi:hypothetical protein